MPYSRITFRRMLPSESLKMLCEEKLAVVSRRFGRSTLCSVIIEHASRREALGPFTVRVHLQVGSHGQSVNASSTHEIALAALRDAFDKVTAQAARWAGGTGPRPRPWFAF